MFAQAQADLLEMLTAACVPGGHLDGVRSVQAGDALNTPDMPIVTVCWDNKHTSRNNGNHVELRAHFVIGLWTASIEDADAADRELQDLLWRWDGEGNPRGLLPWAISRRGWTNTTIGKEFTLLVHPDIVTGAVDSKRHSHYTRGAEISVEVVHQVRLASFVTS